jgi:hypothetical protein
MSALLREIQADAINADVPIATVLRKCAVLAAQLKNVELRDWAFHELNGYGDDDIPTYRVIPAPALANITASGWQHKSAPLASILLPDKLQKRSAAIEFAEPVAALQSLVAGASETGMVMMAWPGDWVLWVQTEGKFNKAARVAVHAIWQEVSKAAVVGIIDTVRNRVLEFCLRLGEQSPELLNESGEAVASPAIETVARNIFNQVFVFGNHTGTIANASPGATATTNVEAGDLAGLLETLRELGVPEGDVQDLGQSIVLEKDTGGVGPKVTGWLARASQAVASGAWKIGSGVGVGVITKLVLEYYGIAF